MSRWLTILAFALAAASPSVAHETWLLPDRFVIAAGDTVKLELTSGMEFPSAESAVKPERVRRAQFRLAGKSFDLPKPQLGDKSLSYDAKLPNAGVAVVWIELAPRSIELTDKQVEHYFEEIGASEQVRKVWAGTAKPRQFREMYTKHAKSIIQVGGPTDDSSWSVPCGLKLELVPVSNPMNLRTGDQLRLKVLSDGNAFAGFRVGIQDENAKRGQFGTSDADGLVSLRFPSDGRCMIFGTDLRPPVKPGEAWASDFTTLTISVKPKR